MVEKNTVAIAVLCVAMVLFQGLGANAAQEAARTSTTLVEEKSTYFLPSLHGWPFTNSYHFKGKLKELLGYWVPGGNIIKLDMDVGFCGGMCYAALDRFYRAEYISNNIPLPKQGQTLYNELRQRQMDSLPFSTISTMRSWQKGEDWEVGMWTKTNFYVWVKPLMDLGYPAQLLLLKTTGRKYSTLVNNHQVIAYRYTIDEANKRVEIGIYDPNYPNNNDVSISFYYDSNYIQASHSEGDTLRGFFRIQYDKDRTVPTINTLESDGCSHLEDRCVQGVRQGLFKIEFHWSCNFIPSFTLEQNNVIFENIECEEASGNYETEIWVEKRLEDSYHQSIDLFSASKENHIVFPIEFVPPAIEAHPFIHSMDQRYTIFVMNVPETMIADAELSDVVMVYPNDEPFSDDKLTQEEKSDYWDRRIYVQGEDIYHSCDRGGPTGLRWITDYKLGYVKVPIRCEVEEEGLVGTINREGESYLIDPYAMVIPITKIDATYIDIQNPQDFIIYNGFSPENYDQDHVLIFIYEATDQASQVAEGYLQIYAKSLLCIQYTETLCPAWGPEDWSDILAGIHAVVDVSLELELDPRFPELPFQIQEEISSFIDSMVVDRVNQELEQLETDSEVWNQISQSNMQIYDSIKNELDTLLYTEENYYDAMIKAEKLKLELTTRTTENTANILANEIYAKLENEFINILKDEFDILNPPTFTERLIELVKSVWPLILLFVGILVWYVKKRS